MRKLSAVTVVLMLSGCLPFHTRNREEQRNPAPDRRPVVMKEAPVSLIASDGSRCLVGEKKFANTEIGDRVWCVWSGKNARKTAYSIGNEGAMPSGRRHPESGGVKIGIWP
jgi:hypothetical protein